MLVTHRAGPHLYYWRDNNTLMRVTIGSGAVEVAAHVPGGTVRDEDAPTWALHVHAAGDNYTLQASQARGTG